MRYVVVLIACSLIACTNASFFHPDKAIYRTPKEVGVDVDFVDGIDALSPTLRGWIVRSDEPRGVVIHFHGNAQNISAYLRSVVWAHEMNFDVVMIDYRGYGPSDGIAEIDGIHADLARIVDFTKQRYPNVPVVLFGQSLGGAVALWLAAQPEYATTFSTLVLESSFASYRSIARDRLRSTWLLWLLQYPLGFLITDEYSPSLAVERAIAERGANALPPTLLIHDDADRVVPLSEAISPQLVGEGRACLMKTSGVPHIYYSAEPEARPRIQRFVRSALESNGDGAVDCSSL